MDSHAKLTTGMFAAMLVLLTAALAFVAAENRQMRAVLIEQTLTQLERDYQQARIQEEEHITTLRASLQDAFEELSTLRGLSADETELLDTAISLTDEILKAATSKGINRE